MNKGKKLSLSEIQKETLQVLVEFDRLCGQIEGGINYSLAYGTLIGAIRHNGFIPWDDDVDVWMKRADYEKFCKYVDVHRDNILPYRLCDRKHTKNYPYGISRFSNGNYIYESTDEKKKKFELGLFVDIYPIDNYGNNRQDGQKIYRKMKWMNDAYIAYLNPDDAKTKLKHMIKCIISFFYGIRYGSGFYKDVDEKIYKTLQKYTSDTDILCGVPVWDDDIVQFDKSLFSEYTMHKFEDYEFKIFSEYDKILTQIYGNYMELPPVDKRVPTHFYNIYKKQVENKE